MARATASSIPAGGIALFFLFDFVPSPPPLLIDEDDDEADPFLDWGATAGVSSETMDPEVEDDATASTMTMGAEVRKTATSWSTLRSPPSVPSTLSPPSSSADLPLFLPTVKTSSGHGSIDEPPAVDDPVSARR